jgi:mono/diheme cytochrome c family protein
MKKVTRRRALVMAAFLCFVAFVSVSYTTHSAGQNNNAAQNTLDASTLFARNCAKCHGKDGRAKTFRGKLTGARNLTDAEWQANVSDERLFNSITNGRDKMPSFSRLNPSSPTYVVSRKSRQ